MPYETLLLHLDGAAQAGGLVEAACQVARSHGSHVVAVATTGNAAFEGSLAATMLSSRDLHGAIEAARALGVERASTFEAHAAELGLASCEVVVDDRDATSAIAERSLCADLVVLGRPQASHPNPTWSMNEFERSLATCAAPMLVVPASSVSRGDGFARRVLVGWTPEPACRRAVVGALPLLRAAERVEVVHVESPFDPAAASLSAPDLRDVVAWLGRHGVGTVPVHRTASEVASRILLDEAARSACDLVVMGAWGRARWVERVLGGVTRSMLDDMPVPVLFAH